MVLMTDGEALSWAETKKHASHVQKHGLAQFVSLYRKLKDRCGDVLKWGDEIEYVIVRFDDEKRRAQLSLRGAEIFTALDDISKKNTGESESLWSPEYASYMVEGTPGKPYGGLMAHFNVVESSMRARRMEIIKQLKDDERVMSVTGFPRLGCPNFTWPPLQPTPHEGFSRSLFFPDDAINQRIKRFTTLTRNIRERRGEKVAINIPIYKDTNTPNPFVEDLSAYGDDGQSQRAALPDHVYMDAMGFGMGRSCIQVTFQACNIDEARQLYDQLTPFCPIMLALTASSSISRGFLTDQDTRWSIISASVDCRNRQERGLEPLTDAEWVIPKSRYSSVDCYISPDGDKLDAEWVIPKSRYSSVDCYISPDGDKYNDVPMLYREEDYRYLVDAGIDPQLSKHVAHFFIRDPLSLFKERLELDDANEIEHFDAIHSIVWQSVRFKPPPVNSTIGWRVEFRPCELQLTDFENAAVVCVVVLFTRVILSFGLDLLMPISKDCSRESYSCSDSDLLMPISKVEENMKRAERRDAVLTEKFWFRSDILATPVTNGKTADDDTTASADGSPSADGSRLPRSTSVREPELAEMTINEIINGKEGNFPGLASLCRSYLSGMDVDADTHCSIERYLKLIQRRASGELTTTARWMRDYVRQHPDYKHDSVVSESINYDLLKTIDSIQQGRVRSTSLLGKNPTSHTKQNVPDAVRKGEHSNCPVHTNTF